MPISPIVLQRRHAELGRIRLGDQQATGSGGTRPNKLSRFRLTSHSERYIKDLAELYGGEARPWDNNGVASWEVYTTAASIPVIAVKGGLSQWMEYWAAGGCIHRCDGENNVLTGNACDLDEKITIRVRGRDVQINPHAEAKPTTRLSVMLPELEAIGVWRMESHGWNAAAEIPAVAELAQYVGDLVPANLHLVERRSIKDGKTSRFVVPVLDLQIGTARLKEIVAERSGGAAELASTERPALEAGPSGADEFTPLLGQLDDVSSVEALTELWNKARERQLVGTGAADTARAREFVAAWKAKAGVLRSASQSSAAGGDSGPASPPSPAAATPAAEPDEDGVVDAELVDDADPEAVWQRILLAAGQQGMETDQVAEDFSARMGGLIPDDASAAELSHYLGLLTQERVA